VHFVVHRQDFSFDTMHRRCRYFFGFPGPKEFGEKPDLEVRIPPHHSRAPHMKKESEDEKKPLFQIWLEAYNSRLVQVAQGSPSSKAPMQARSADQEGPKTEPPSGNDA
jgi:hypothetical protein